MKIKVNYQMSNNNSTVDSYIELPISAERLTTLQQQYAVINGTFDHHKLDTPSYRELRVLIHFHGVLASIAALQGYRLISYQLPQFGTTITINR